MVDEYNELRHADEVVLPIINLCGSCNACCWVYPITASEIRKPAWQPCKHLTDVGCEIYANRPQLCRNFHCEWLRLTNAGHDLPWKWRPDQLGVVIQIVPFPELAGINGYDVCELRQEAGDDNIELDRFVAYLRQLNPLPIAVTIHGSTNPGDDQFQE